MSRITFVPKNANLLENLDQGKNQDPYVIIKVGNSQKQNAPHYQGGLRPVWKNKSLTFDLNGEKEAIIMVVDYDPTVNGQVVDEIIGQGLIDLTQLIPVGNGEVTQDLQFQGTNQGSVTLQFEISGSSQPAKKQAKSSDPNVGKTIGGYRLEKFLGAGSYGSAYKSIRLSDKEIVCVKIVKKSKLASPIEKKMFQEEIRIMRKFDHPNIIHLYDLLESGSSYYLVMQLCNQGDVRQYMQGQGKNTLKEDEAVFFMKQVAMGFRQLHEANVMHRDFKLDNLFMNDSCIVIADLGFAKAGANMTSTGCGTPAYMAPEILEGKMYDNMVDMWSIGVSFYEILFGGFPFMGSDGEMARKAKYYGGNNLKIPHNINRISKDCESVLKRMLTYNPHQRISWSEFFNHPLFNVKENTYGDNYAPLGSTVNFRKDLNNRFEKYRTADNTKPYNVMGDIIAALVEKKGEVAFENLDTVIAEENEDIEEVDLGDDMKEKLAAVSQRYFLEKQKIEFIRMTACKLFDLRERMVLPEYNSSTGDAGLMGKLNSNGVPATVLACLTLLKVSKTFSDFNLQCLKDNKNLFELEDFDQWIVEGNSRNIQAQYEDCNNDINMNMDTFMAGTQNVQWSEADKTHVVDKLNGALEMSVQKNVIKAKLVDLGFLLQFPGFNDDLKLRILQCSVFGHFALKINELVTFTNDSSFTAQAIFNKYDNMNYENLEKTLKRYQGC